MLIVCLLLPIHFFIEAHVRCISSGCEKEGLTIGQTPKSDTPPNIAPKIVTPETYVQICDSYATLIGQLAIVTLFGAKLGGVPLFGPYPLHYLAHGVT